MNGLTLLKSLPFSYQASDYHYIAETWLMKAGTQSMLQNAGPPMMGMNPHTLLPEQQNQCWVCTLLSRLHMTGFTTHRKLHDWLPLNSESQPSDASFYKWENGGLWYKWTIRKHSSYSLLNLNSNLCPYHTLPWNHLSPLARNSQFYKGWPGQNWVRSI